VKVHSSRALNEAIIDDMNEILRLLGLGDHARVGSPHYVMQTEIIPAIEKLVSLPPDGAPGRNS
jgi:hypothetical protein